MRYLFVFLIFFLSNAYADTSVFLANEKDDILIYKIKRFTLIGTTKEFNKRIQKAVDNSVQKCSIKNKKSYSFFSRGNADISFNANGQIFGYNKIGFLADLNQTDPKYFTLRFFCAKSPIEARKKFKISKPHSLHSTPLLKYLVYNNLYYKNNTNFTSMLSTQKIDRQIAEAENAKIEEKKKKEKQKLAKLEEEKKAKAEKERKRLERNKYAKNCEPSFGGLAGYKQGTPEYEKCIDEKIADAERAKIEEKKKKEKQRLAKLEEEKLKKLAAKQEKAKLAKMSADDRRDYTCEKKFGFRKGSNKFNDCRFKLFTAEMELQKIQMQKELAEAKAEAAKARADAERVRAEAASTSQARQEALLSAQTEAAKMQAAAAMAQAQASNMQSSLQMINQGLNMMSGPTTPSVNLRTTCTYTGTFLNCF